MNNQIAQLESLLNTLFNAIQEAYPGNTINLSQPTSNCWFFGGTSEILYLWATADSENEITLYATTPEDIEESGACTNKLHTAIGTIIIAEDF